jgi:hypothetical protein
MSKPKRTTARTQNTKKETLARLTEAPVQSQGAKDARVEKRNLPRFFHLASLAFLAVLSLSSPFRQPATGKALRRRVRRIQARLRYSLLRTP